MSSRGQVAYEEYRAVQLENGDKAKTWEQLAHRQRLGWQAAAVAVAKTVTIAEANDWKGRAVYEGRQDLKRTAGE